MNRTQYDDRRFSFLKGRSRAWVDEDVLDDILDDIDQGEPSGVQKASGNTRVEVDLEEADVGSIPPRRFRDLARGV